MFCSQWLVPQINGPDKTISVKGYGLVKSKSKLFLLLVWAKSFFWSSFLALATGVHRKFSTAFHSFYVVQKWTPKLLSSGLSKPGLSKFEDQLLLMLEKCAWRSSIATTPEQWIWSCQCLNEVNRNFGVYDTRRDDFWPGKFTVKPSVLAFHYDLWTL